MTAIVVLGCKLVFDAQGRLAGAGQRRVKAAARAWERSNDDALVVVSGGRMWNGVVEADAMQRALIEEGVPRDRIVRERCSFDTVDNARFTAALLERRAITEVVLVTCDWHLPRARRMFERSGVRVQEAPAVSPQRNLRSRVYRWGREHVAEWLSLWLSVGLVLALAGCDGCRSSDVAAQSTAVRDGSAPDGAVDPVEWSAIARAEDRRRATDIGEAMLVHPDVRVRRRAARALARIADEASIPGLMRVLSDEDETVIAWAAYGLGYTCKGNEERHVAALSSAAASRTAVAARSDGGLPKPAASEGKPSKWIGDNLDARTAIARAIGRCGDPRAESLLTEWVRARGPWTELAAYGLGDMAARKGALGDDAIAALIDAAPSSPGGGAAFYGLGRLKRVGDPRLLEAARASLANATVERIFAVRALSRAGAPAAPELAKIVRDRSFTVAERAEAARGLAQLEAPGREAAADPLTWLAGDTTRDPIALLSLGGDEYGVLTALVDVFQSGDVPKGAEPALSSLARFAAPGTVPPPLARRLAHLRCTAASALAKGAYDSELLSHCDAPGTVDFERARLAVLRRQPMQTAARRAAWAQLARSANLQVQEAALEALEGHPELGETARSALAAALRSGKGGLVATAADALRARKPDPILIAALKDAIAHPWPEDQHETRIALIDAAAAMALPNARELALAACKSPNVTVRERAAKALAKLAPDAAPTCAADAAHPNDTAVAPEIEAGVLARPAKLLFETDAGRLSLTLEPQLSPVTASRLTALAESGFFKGMLVHRVVPGYVVQFGDPGGDGYGGSGRALRCETSPVPFEPLTVGMALAGRDTGSSQIFVTLSRTAHLDGEYTRVGRAEGDWAAVAQGDIIRDVRVER